MHNCILISCELRPRVEVPKLAIACAIDNILLVDCMQDL